MNLVLWIRLLALAAVALIIACPILGVIPLLGQALILCGGVLSIWALVVGLGPHLRRRGKYDLGELQRVHEAEELRALHWNEAPIDPIYVLCSCCMEEYPHKLPACPRCSKK